MKVEDFTNEKLLEMYELVVRTNHYDPHETPAIVKSLWESGIDEGDLRREVLRRLGQ